MQEQDHEVVTLFKEKLIPLSGKLTEMLNEHFSHQSERRGCGYTQATRLLAEFINEPRESEDNKDYRIFSDYKVSNLKAKFPILKQQGLELDDWRNLDESPEVKNYLNTHHADGNAATNLLFQETQFQQNLRQIHENAVLEESKLICRLIADIVLPKNNQQHEYVELTCSQDKPKVGSCPMAEDFFLQIAHHRILRQGSINIFVDHNNCPILLEKMNMGDNHSCISLAPVLMNGVCLPAGSLFSLDYDLEQIENKRPNQKVRGHVIPVDAVKFWFLRLTTLAVSPENRQRTFTTHFKQQIDNNLFSPETTRLSQLVDIANEQI
ncbi:phytochelatin synthase family protein [Acinetobacter sp. MB5]|uniref:phytochelatin synthase family protein n=1 Tax=Acinetobacter sp. MB5 TaxID=2069438 RepID=UPI000DD061B8|nr:phytochelatin synthase family protein [Acinetobacter sp. MB5]